MSNTDMLGVISLVRMVPPKVSSSLRCSRYEEDGLRPSLWQCERSWMPAGLRWNTFLRRRKILPLPRIIGTRFSFISFVKIAARMPEKKNTHINTQIAWKQPSKYCVIYCLCENNCFNSRTWQRALFSLSSRTVIGIANNENDSCLLTVLV